MKKLVLTLAAFLTLSTQAGVVMPTMSLEEIYVIPRAGVEKDLSTDKDLINRGLKRRILPTTTLEESFIIPHTMEEGRFEFRPQLRR